MKSNEEIVDKLTDLAQLDYDAVQCYKQALDEVDDSEVRQKFMQFQRDHQEHIRNLNSAITELGGEPYEPSSSAMGLLTEGFTAVRSKIGTNGALHAMETNEKLTNKRYGEAVKMDMPAHAKEVLRRHLEDEKGHLHYIQQSLSVRAKR